MRILTATAVVTALALGAPALAQSAPPQADTQPPQAQSSPQIRSIRTINVDELQASDRAKVESLAARTNQQELESLRQSIDATPQAVAALKAKGMTSAQVVAVNIDASGVLTLFTKKAT